MPNCCCIDVDETSTVIADEIRRARKPHTCCECGETIHPGSVYTYERTRHYDGYMQSFKTCARCRNIRDEYFTCGWYYEGMVEMFQECFGFDYRQGLPPDFAPCRSNQ